MFVSFQDLLVKQGPFLHELWPDSAEKRDILNTGNLDTSGNLILEICSLVNCLSPVKAEHCIFFNTGIFMDGRNKENRASKLKINGIVSWSVINLSGRTQGSEF